MSRKKRKAWLIELWDFHHGHLNPDRMREIQILERLFDPDDGPNLAEFIERTAWVADARGTTTPSLER